MKHHELITFDISIHPSHLVSYIVDYILKLPIQLESVVDVGCSVGSISEVLHPSTRHLTLIDVDKTVLDIARGKLGDHHYLSYLYGNLACFKGQADLIFYFMSLHHIKDIHTEIDHVCQRLLPGGYLLICDVAPGKHRFHHHDDVPHDGICENQLRQLLADHHLNIVQSNHFVLLKDHLPFDAFLLIAQLSY